MLLYAIAPLTVFSLEVSVLPLQQPDPLLERQFLDRGSLKLGLEPRRLRGLRLRPLPLLAELRLELKETDRGNKGEV